MLLQPNGPAHSRLRGGLVNNDGKGKAAFQHPSGASQADLLTDVWKQFQVQRIDHIECHGTGTLLGDPIEVAGLSSAVERFESLRGSSITIGSVKSNLGHTGAAAGVVAFVKTCLALKHLLIPQSLHCQTLNPELKLGSSLVVAQELQSFQCEKPCAAVSSFGLGGTNAHSLLEGRKAESAVGHGERMPCTSFRRDVFWPPQMQQTITDGHGYTSSSCPSCSRHPILEEVPWINGQKHYHCELNRSDEHVAFLWQHQVNGVVLFPGASFVELFVEVGVRLGFDCVCLQDVVFVNPLVLDHEDGMCQFRVRLEEIDAEKCRVQATSLHGEKVFAKALLLCGAATDPLPFDGAEERSVIDLKGVYETTSYGPAFQTVQRMDMGDSTATARLWLQGGCCRSGFCIEPTLLDGAFQVLLGKFNGRAVWPRCIKSVQFTPHTISQGMDVQAMWADSMQGSLNIFSANRCVMRVQSLEFSSKPLERQDLVFQGVWDEAPLPRVEFQKAGVPSCVGFSSQTGPTNQLLAQLGERMEVKVVDWDRVQVTAALPDFKTGANLIFAAGLACCGSESLSQDLSTSCLCLIRLVQALLREKKYISRLLVLTTCAADVDDAPLHLSQSSFVGLSRAIQRECKQLSVLHVDLGPLQPASFTDYAKMLADEICSESDQVELGIAYRGDRRYAWRLRPVPLRLESPRRLSGAYVVTGGLGGLGLEIGEWLCKKGVFELILTSRNGQRKESPRFQGKLESMKKLNCIVTVDVGDISKQDTVKRLFSKISSRVTGIVHAAGVLHDESISKVTWDSFMSVFKPKAMGAQWLHEASQDRQLADFVLMSSTSAALGSVCQTSYSAANSVLDALAVKRREQKLAGLSINWGPWAEVGMAAEAPPTPGLRSLAVSHALDALGQAGRPWQLFGFFFGALETHAIPLPLEDL